MVSDDAAAFCLPSTKSHSSLKSPSSVDFCNVYCFYFSLKHLIVHCYLLLFSYCIYHTSHMSFVVVAAAAAKLLQSYLTLCDPIDGSPPGSPVPGILQARTLEWVAISFSNAWKGKVKVKSVSRLQLLATPWTAASQAPPSMGFPRQEHWSGVPLPSLFVVTLTKIESVPHTPFVTLPSPNM